MGLTGPAEFLVLGSVATVELNYRCALVALRGLMRSYDWAWLSVLCSRTLLVWCVLMC